MNRFQTFSRVLAVTAALAVVAPAVQALEPPVTQTAASQAALSPTDALAMLQAGNARFVAGEMLQRDLSGQVSATAAGQYPHSIVLGCIDSRVPPELVFDQGLGDIFSPRIAGNVVTPELLGSMEFAAGVAGSRAIVVLGHTECGAVKGACDGVELGNLTSNLAHIQPAVEAVPVTEGPRNSTNTAWVNAVAHENVAQTVQRILTDSPLLKQLVDEGKLQVVGAMYDVATGKVEFL
ncbi:carbonic anhydrase family protein [Haliea sp. E1-2-M8]|uniref:carbonic anhydrase family protein n=1 Tax=Haliea sp. E1-2-M8 TaxID=3064706 RepID=UPI002715B34C|nr:carbonic anhydrase family protein [Haliea sp. E1-2-M8]MDO8860340.1 carbonic anhydrase family protein [Haliea sp. E1-2-M8]